jgi:two-component system phosphate regulon sensor histidine kinase PhoR
MSIALVGIAVIQYTWLKRSVDLNKDNFENKVTFALNRVKAHLEDDASDMEKFDFRDIRSGIFKIQTDNKSLEESPASTFREETYRKKWKEWSSIITMLNPSEALNSIAPSSLDKYMKNEMGSAQVNLNYDYGIYSNEAQDYTITNGKFRVLLDNDAESSDGGVERNLDRSTYEVGLFSLEGNEPGGYLRVFFPKRNTFLLKTILPSLISSLIFTGLILFCFVYTINIILTQKKISMMKTDFINNMTHEFKTPIATISLAADSINNPKISSKPDQIVRYANIIKEENQRMLQQVEKVLQIAKVDKKEFQLKLTEVDVNTLVKTAADHTELKIAQREGILTLDLAALNSTIIADENHISNMIHNLLDNANKYSKGQPNITIKTRDTKGGIEIIVSDKGIGMQKDELKRIFEKFYRVSTGNLHDVKGFGLGLSYVKAIVDAHKGRISVESELGKGSSFTVFLPKNKSLVK